MHTYQIRQANFNEIQLMLSWAAQEQWNPGLNDAFVYPIIDPRGFFMGFIDDQPVSCISLVKYSTHFSFLGFFIVAPDHRGKKLGHEIFQHALAYGKKSNIGLDGVVAQQPYYQKMGFHLAYRNIRYGLSNHPFKNFSHPQLHLANTLPIADILEYDRVGFPDKREPFLTAWLLMNNATSIVYYDKKVQGYGVIRQCREGYKIGPLFAENREIATIIFKGLCASILANEQPIYLDIPETNPAARLLVEEFSMMPVFETARMYSKKALTLAIDKIFGVTSFEVG